MREIFDITFNKGNLHKIILRCVYIKFLNSQDELFLKNVHCNIYLKFSIHETFSNINPFHPQTFNFKYCPARRRKEREKKRKRREKRISFVTIVIPNESLIEISGKGVNETETRVRRPKFSDVSRGFESELGPNPKGERLIIWAGRGEVGDVEWKTRHEYRSICLQFASLSSSILSDTGVYSGLFKQWTRVFFLFYSPFLSLFPAFVLVSGECTSTLGPAVCSPSVKGQR